jgi:hypothetical protein
MPASRGPPRRRRRRSLSCSKCAQNRLRTDQGESCCKRPSRWQRPKHGTRDATWAAKKAAREGAVFASHDDMRDESSPWLGLLSFAAFAACGPSIPHPPYAPQATTALTPVEAAPPPGRAEYIPKQPPGANAWVDGEWILRHGRWYWLLGRWVKSPPGARYSPWVVVRAVDGTLFHAPSIWVDAHGSSMAAPAPIAYATANGEAVVDAEGEVSNTGRNIQSVPPARRLPAEQPSP